ncbi:MAG TPA: c-type cytochrome [Burkholderiales bacterium]
MQSIRKAFLVPCLFALAVLAGQAVADEILPPEKTGGVDLGDPEVIRKGSEILFTTCGGYCHGSDAGGFKGPPLRARPDLEIKGLYAVINFGRKRAGKIMPAWKGTLTDEQIWSVIAAIVSLRTAEPSAVKRESH